MPSLGPLLPGSLGHGACVPWRLQWGALCLRALPACRKNSFPGEVPLSLLSPGDRSRSLEAPGALSEARSESHAPVC